MMEEEKKVFCSCGRLVIAEKNDVIKIRGKIFIFKHNCGYTVCHGCKQEIKVVNGNQQKFVLVDENKEEFIKVVCSQ